jgi:hypothetical protein
LRNLYKFANDRAVYLIILNMDIKSYEQNNVEGDLIYIRYIPLSAFTGKYAPDKLISQIKKHDINKIKQSIIKYGFIDPPKWDSNLNGFVFGNGRTEAVINLLKELKNSNKNPPPGIGIHKESGEWCIPCKFGIDANNETSALALSIDHNNLTVGGADIEISKMWNEMEYLNLLNELKEDSYLPISVNQSDLDNLIKDLASNTPDEDIDKDSEDKEKTKKMKICPNCGHEF